MALTPEQNAANIDAHRRDLTINALFYNINEGKIEDFTGKGLADLKTKTLRTPLDPVKTFMDDPLRILRMLRFFSRYGGSRIDPAALDAMKNPEVQQALKTKVSPERVLTEWKKLFAGAQQGEALRVLHDTGLWNALFSDRLKGRNADDLHPFTMDQKNKWHVDNVLEHTLKVVKNYDEILRADGAGDDERAYALIAAFFHDLGKLDPSVIGVKDTAEGIFHSYHGHEDVSALVANAILEGLKASNEDIHYIKSIVQNHMMPHDSMTDKTLRKLIRNLGRDLVRRIIQHAKADATSKPGANVEHYDRLLDKAQNITPSAPANNNNAPVINGQVLMGLFPNLKPASGFIREINNRLQDMKDENPNLAEPELMAAVEQMRPEIEAQFGNYVKTKRPSQKPVAPPRPTLPPLQPPAVQASWYGQTKAAEAKQLCGVVLKRLVGLYDTDPTLVLETPQRLYAIKMTGESGDVSELEKLLGQTICALGLLDGDKFIISKYSPLKGEEHPDQVKIEREKPSQATLFREGDRVRKRKVGLGFEQIEGKVVRIDNGLMYIKWNGIDDQQVVRLTDTVALHGLIQRL